VKRVLIAIVLIAIAVAIYFLLNREKYSSVEQAEIEFAIEDAAAVTRIELRNRDNKKVVLDKKEGLWWVNEQYPAFDPVMDKFFKRVLTKIQVMGPVAQAAKENIIREMIGHAIQVKIFAGSHLIRSYYVGGSDPLQKGTYMWIEGAETPYVVHVPGNTGYLTPYYHLIEEDWYSRSIFDFDRNEIRSVNVVYRDKPEESFFLERKDSTYKISPAIAGERMNQIVAKSYFSLFKFKNFEGFPDYLSQESKDSIGESKPFVSLELRPVKGPLIVLRAYKKGGESNNTLYDKQGNILAYDPERYFALFTGFPKMVTIQDYVFGQIFANRSDFYRP
jgi:hypothetical protein